RGGVTIGGVGRALFNIGLDTFGSALGGAQFGKMGPVPPSGELVSPFTSGLEQVSYIYGPTHWFTFGFGQLVYGAYNLRSGWAIPDSGHSSPAVGAFEY